LLTGAGAGCHSGAVIWWILILCLGLSACQAEEPPAGGGAAAFGDGVVAVVNGVAISRGEFESSLAHAERSFSPKPGEKAALAQRVLEKMVADELLIQHARARGIRVTPEEVEQKLEEIARAGGGKAALDDFLKRSGLDETRMRANLERNLMIERLAGQLRGAIRISAPEVEKYYREHQAEFRRGGSVELAHILFREGEKDPLERARKVHAEIQAGLPFEKAVKKYSDDALTRDRGGALGTLNRGEMLPELEAAAFSQKPGAVSPPVRTPRGVHLLWVKKRETGGVRPLDELREEIRTRMLDSLVESKLAELAERLHREGNVRLGRL
jgi:parvulin-like peptidyl-prolyl isomerase